MNDATTSDAWQVFRRVYWTLAVALAALLVLLALMGFGPGGRNCAATPSAATGDPAKAAASGAPAQTRAACAPVALA
jgi:hypothetical protein